MCVGMGLICVWKFCGFSLNDRHRIPPQFTSSLALSGSLALSHHQEFILDPIILFIKDVVFLPDRWKYNLLFSLSFFFLVYINPEVLKM